MYNTNTSRAGWKHCSVYRGVNRGCPRGHMLVSHWSKNALLRNLYLGESKRAGGVRNPATTLPVISHVSILLRVSRECIYFWVTQTTQRVTVIEVRLFNQIGRGHVTIKIIISACRLETFEGFFQCSKLYQQYFC